LRRAAGRAVPALYETPTASAVGSDGGRQAQSPSERSRRADIREVSASNAFVPGATAAGGDSDLTRMSRPPEAEILPADHV